MCYLLMREVPSLSMLSDYYRYNGSLIIKNLDLHLKLINPLLV